MRLFLGGLCHETNVFSPVQTRAEDFDVVDPARDEPALTEAKLARVFGFSDTVAAARATQHDLAIGFFGAAEPSGPPQRAHYEGFRSRLLETLRDAGAIDAVLLFMHGAQVAEGYPDCEGDLLSAVRAAVGPRIPVAVLLDLHTNLTPAMIRNATFVATCWEYPHVDLRERAADLIKLLEGSVAGKLDPVAHVHAVAGVGIVPTASAAGRPLLDALREASGIPGVLSVSLCHGFAHADIEAVGAAAIVITQRGQAGGQHIAAKLARAWIVAAKRFRAENPLIDRGIALDQAEASSQRPVVIAERSDNSGGGASADATFFLHEIRRRGLTDVAAGVFFSPDCVRQATDVGIGNSGHFRLGGVNGPASGPVFEFDGRVLAVSHSVQQELFGVGPWRALGHSVALEYEGVTLVVNNARQQVHSRHCFTGHGIDLAQQRLVIVKSTAHFLTDFSKVCPTVLFSDGPGTFSYDLATVPFRHVRRPLWPLDNIDNETALSARVATSGFEP